MGMHVLCIFTCVNKTLTWGKVLHRQEYVIYALEPAQPVIPTGEFHNHFPVIFLLMNNSQIESAIKTLSKVCGYIAAEFYSHGRLGVAFLNPTLGTLRGEVFT